MSIIATVTTTTTRTSAPLIDLGDYEVHHSVHEEPTPMPFASVAPDNMPLNWPVDHRRIPAFRPINRNLDMSERPAGSNPFESVLINVMLHGVWLNAVTSRVWRFTGGRLNDRLFHYRIGGEW